MKTLIVYDSFFGNTQKLAEAIADTLGDDAVAKRVVNTVLSDIEDCDCILFGSPTRGFAPTREIRQFLKLLPKGVLASKRIGVFDTRINVEQVNVKVFSFLAGIFGYAADSLEKLTKKLGAERVSVDWFYVMESEGPLAEGETQRAVDWARSIT